MTTKPEIRRWVRPILESRSDVVLDDRALILTPVRHIARGIYFMSSSSKNRPQVAWFMDVLFAAPGSWNSFFDHHLPVGLSDADDFEEGLRDQVDDSLNGKLLPVATIRAFHDFAVGEERRFTFLNLDRYAFEQATVLAALGQIERAHALLAPAIAELEAKAHAELERGQLELRKRKNSGIGKDSLAFGTRDLELACKLRLLLAAMEANDCPAIAALLHQWEHERVKQRGIEPLWQPTPFPIEQGAGG